MNEHEIPPGLEDRVVRALRAEGALAPASTPWPMRRLAAIAAMLIVATAWGGFQIGRSSAAPGGSGDKYLLLLYGAQTATPAEEASRVAEYSAWAGSLAAARRLDAAERLGDASRTAGVSLPGLQSAPPPLGFFVVRAGSFDEASRIAEECPHVKYGGTVVIRKAE